jgi:hypothetical protein
MRFLLCLLLAACHKDATTTDTSSSNVVVAPLPTTTATTTTAATSTTAPQQSGDEAGARALLGKFLAPGADHAALSKPLRPATADYGALFDAETAAKLGPQYEHHWDKDPMVIAPKEGQTELKLFAATSEDLVADKGNAHEFPGGWKRVAPHLKPHQTWYRFKFVKPGEDLGMAFDGLTFVNGHWVITPKPWAGL